MKVFGVFLKDFLFQKILCYAVWPEEKKPIYSKALNIMEAKITYYKCECCEKQYFYLRRYPTAIIVCSSCGWEKKIYPEGLRFLASGKPLFFTKVFHRFTDLQMSVLDGAI